MSETNDIESQFDPLPTPGEEPDSKQLAYLIAAHVMEEYEPGFVLIGSPIMANTPTGRPYPNAVGIVINHDIGLTPYSLASILEELAQQLASSVNQIEDFLKEESEGSNDSNN